MRVLVSHGQAIGEGALDGLVTAFLQERHAIQCVPAGRFATMGLRRAARKARPDLICACGDGGAGEAVARQLRLSFHTLGEKPPEGVAPELYLPPPFAPRAAEGRLALGCGADAPGLEALLHAVAAPEGLRLAVLVFGRLPPALQDLAAQAEPGRVAVFASVGEHARMADLLSGCDILLQPPALLGCMAAGRAIVAPGDAGEFLVHEENALLFRSENEAWQSVLRLIAEPALRSALGQAARQAVRRRGLSWRDQVRRIIVAANA
jgi:hypothetical protein